VTLEIESPEMLAAGTRSPPAQERIELSPPAAANALRGAALGRATALLVLERLHQMHDDLPREERLLLEHLTRTGRIGAR